MKHKVLDQALRQFYMKPLGVGIKAGGGCRFEDLDKILEELAMKEFVVSDKMPDTRCHVILDSLLDGVGLYVDGELILTLKDGDHPLCRVDPDALVRLGIASVWYNFKEHKPHGHGDGAR